MKLAAGAVVASEKVRDYLLAADHPSNGGKAALFTAFGFSRADWPALAAALVQHAVDNLVISSRATAFGVIHVVKCNLPSPDGRNPCLTSVWVVETGRTRPQLVTAFGTR